MSGTGWGAGGDLNRIEPDIDLAALEAQARDAARRLEMALRRFGDDGVRVEIRAGQGAQPDGRRAWVVAASAAIAVMAAASSMLVAGDGKKVSERGATNAAPLMTEASLDGQSGGDRVQSGQRGRRVVAAQLLRPTTVVLNGQSIETIHPLERVRLCREIARAQGLQRAGLHWADLYGVIHAETAWIPRDGMGKNGRVSRGLGQLEDATARALGVADPDDAEQAIRAAARLMVDSAAWADRRGVKGSEARLAAMSVYYNLSTKARNAWNGVSMAGLPVETRRHIKNVAEGRMLALKLGAERDRFDRRWGAMTMSGAQADAGGAPGPGGANVTERRRGYAGGFQPEKRAVEWLDGGESRHRVQRARREAARSGVTLTSLSANLLPDQLKQEIAARQVAMHAAATPSSGTAGQSALTESGAADLIARITSASARRGQVAQETVASEQIRQRGG